MSRPFEVLAVWPLRDVRPVSGFGMRSRTRARALPVPHSHTGGPGLYRGLLSRGPSCLLVWSESERARNPTPSPQLLRVCCPRSHHPRAIAIDVGAAD